MPESRELVLELYRFAGRVYCGATGGATRSPPVMARHCPETGEAIAEVRLRWLEGEKRQVTSVWVRHCGHPDDGDFGKWERLGIGEAQLVFQAAEPDVLKSLGCRPTIIEVQHD